METTWSRPIALSRSVWSRAGDRLVDLGALAMSMLSSWWHGWQAARVRAAEFRALRELSPDVLRDIGAPPEWIHEAQRWREQRDNGSDR